MDIDTTTRIGADGKRYAADEDGAPTGPTESNLFQRRRVTVVGARAEGNNAIIEDGDGNWVWATVELP